MDERCAMNFFFWRVLALCSGCLFAEHAQTHEPWEDPAFSAVPSTMMRAASAAPAGPGVDVVILLKEDRIVFDDAGRSTQTRRIVTRIITKQGAENWGTTEA